MAKRRLLTANGYPESFAGKIMDEGYGSMSGGNFGSRCPEVYTGDALEIAMAVHGALQAHKLTERQYEVFFTHYVVRQPVKVKQHELKLSHTRYYDLLRLAQCNIEPFIIPCTKFGGD